MEASLEEMYANLVIEEDEGDEVDIGNVRTAETKQSYVLVGSFLTDKIINFNAMRNVMSSLWRPKEGMEIHDLGGLRYSFVFYHKLDLQKVIDGGPWTFEQAMLVFKQLKEFENPQSVVLKEVEIWVQIYDIPRGLLSENVFKSIGAAVGGFIKSDPANIDGPWKQYARIRVTLDVEKPIKRRMKLKRDGNAWSWINFKYERLGTFCFVCGRIGHSERDCNVVYANPDKVVDRAYGPWLRAPSKNASVNAGSRWLRNVADGQKSWTCAGSSFSQEQPNTDHDTRITKFMEIDGVVREVNAVNSAVVIKGRETRDMDMGDKDKNQLEGFEGDGKGMDEVVAFENKRKRVEGNLNLENKEDKNAASLENNIEVGPKNGFGAVDAQGHGGGLALFWKNEGGVVITDNTQNFIDFEVSNDQVGRWRYTGFYGYPERERRTESWDLIRNLSHASELPWCIIGDFNDMLCVGEKRGGRVHPRHLMEGFRKTIEDCNLLDLGYQGEWFIWEKSRGTVRWMQERLDRGLANKEWMELSATVQVMEVSTSDHLPLYLTLNRQVYIPKAHRFRFENMWIKEDECRNLVLDCWNGIEGFNIIEKMALVCAKLEEWGGGMIKEMRIQIQNCKKDLRKYRSRRDVEGIQKYNKVMWEFMRLLEKQEIYWQQRAKQFWLREGDKNTRFFHKYAPARKEHNSIKKLKNTNGEWKESDEEIQGIITEYFEQIFQTGGVDEGLSDGERVRTVSDEDNESLLMPVTMAEVKNAVFSMYPEKAPGVDGLNPGFFQAYWSIVAEDITQFCHDFMITGMLPTGINKTLVCLIPKIKHPKQMTDYRPIALCNVLMRILSKVIVRNMCISLMISSAKHLSRNLVFVASTDKTILAIR
ncbi:hypothetical protein AgCh_014971 [Apium graveolens]